MPMYRQASRRAGVQASRRAGVKVWRQSRKEMRGKQGVQGRRGMKQVWTQKVGNKREAVREGRKTARRKLGKKKNEARKEPRPVEQEGVCEHESARMRGSEGKHIGEQGERDQVGHTGSVSL
eukprot:6194348-Pleurochrysis_carterae.AAC.1